MTGSIDFRRITLKVHVDTFYDLHDLRPASGRGFNRFLGWVLADWCRREKRRRKAWERRHGRELGDPE